MAGTGRQIRMVEITPTIDTAAYATGELIGLGGVLKFPTAVPGDEGQTASQSGIIQSVIITDLGKQSANLDLLFFDANPSNTTFTDQAAFDVDDADLINLIGVASVTDWKAFSDNSMGQELNLAMPFTLDAGATLYAALVSRGAPNYVAATDLTIRVGIIDA